MVLAVGSMAVKGVFKAGGLLTGLGSTVGKLKEAQMNSKSTTTEMKRMTGQSHLLAKALGLIGVTGFTALLMQTPQLAGALAKIKTEMMLIAYSVGKHLKPGLDAVATILHGIRTGDWAVVKQGIIDLTKEIVILMGKAGSILIDVIWGAGTADKVAADFKRWMDGLVKAWNDRDLKGLATSAAEAFRWVYTRITGTRGAKEKLEANRLKWAGIEAKEKRDRLQKELEAKDPIWAAKQAMGDSVYGPVKSGGGGTTNVAVDFSGANINLASGIEIEDFANVISMRIAEKQRGVTY